MTTHAVRPCRLFPLAALAALAACSPRQPPAPPAADPGPVKVLATVNGVPITEVDVAQRAGRAMGGAAAGQERSPNVLRTVVREELAYQRAVQLGLDREPEYRVKLEALEAQVRAFRRQEMAVRLRAWAQVQARVTEAEARAWFDANAPLVRTRLHVLQIVHRGQPGRAQADLARLEGGAPFEEVAAEATAGAPGAGQAPWDLGELHWAQLPAPWRGVVDRLEPGAISGIIQGEGGRAWIVKLVGKRVDPAVDFAAEKDRIVELLQQQKVEALQDALAREVDGPGVVYAR